MEKRSCAYLYFRKMKLTLLIIVFILSKHKDFIMNKFFTFFLALFLTFNVFAQDLSRPNKNLGSKEDMTIMLMSEDSAFKDIGLSPKELSRYILQIHEVFSKLVKNNPTINSESKFVFFVEINAISGQKSETCKKDYTQCVMMKLSTEYDNIDDVEIFNQFGKEAMKTKEVKITNFKSKEIVKFVIQFNFPNAGKPKEPPNEMNTI